MNQILHFSHHVILANKSFISLFQGLNDRSTFYGRPIPQEFWLKFDLWLRELQLATAHLGYDLKIPIMPSRLLSDIVKLGQTNPKEQANKVSQKEDQNDIHGFLFSIHENTVGLKKNS